MSKVLRRVLCVDDESDILEVAKLCLETTAGLDVLCCSSGAELLAVVAEAAPDLIMLDVMMPDMDGPSVLKALRRNPALDGIPVVFLTARVQNAEIEQYLKMGATGVICKPFDPMRLAVQIEEIFGGFHAR